ncbi:MBL fold metallo-hydrolase [Halostella pelagica]|uniref:MBL fold metallo-hydrolase n=1 Tax=Halostella pelagica TaxID=2583824 RepID=UPI001080BC95|nr:MBL fold metallo-hydrolase [Halostella pelagica]
MTVSVESLAIDWLGYATVRIESGDGTVVYLDPGRYGVLTGEWEPDTPGVAHPEPRDYVPGDADVVCVTHDHHYDSDGIERVANDDTTVAVYEAVYPPGIDRDVASLDDLPGEVVRVGEHDDDLFADVVVRSLPAYNDPDGPHTRENGEPYHPEGFGVGFHLTIDDTRVFWPGDTDVLPGHEEFDVDVFLPPIGGSFTMDRHSAADLAAALSPTLTIPIHYDTFEALETDSRAFAADVASRGVPVALDESRGD